MTIRAREAVAAEFLRKALAGEALAVPKLDAMGRAPGLLGQVKLRSISGRRIISQRKTSHAPETGDFVTVLVPIITTLEIDVVKRRTIRLDGNVRLYEIRP